MTLSFTSGIALIHVQIGAGSSIHTRVVVQVGLIWREIDRRLTSILVAGQNASRATCHFIRSAFHPALDPILFYIE